MQTPLIIMSKPALIIPSYRIIELLSPLRIFIKGVGPLPLPRNHPCQFLWNLTGQQLTSPFSCDNVPEFTKSPYFRAGVLTPRLTGGKRVCESPSDMRRNSIDAGDDSDPRSKNPYCSSRKGFPRSCEANGRCLLYIF